MALIDNLVSYYKLDEASGNRADSHGANTLTDVNTVGSATGIINLGGDFESGNNEYLSTTTPFTTATTNFSVSLWFKPESIGAYQSIIQNGRQANFWNILVTSGGVFEFFEDNIVEYASSSTLSAGVMYHLVCIKTGDGANNISFYVNGSASGTASAGSISTPTTAGYIGVYTTTGSSFQYYTDGIIDEVGFWSRAITSTEVTSLYNGGAGFAYPFSSPSGPANLKSYNTNLAANIKSINTNLIANVKSLDSNV